MRICSFEGCDNEFLAKDLCSTHYAQYKRGIDLKPIREKRGPLCTFEGCERPHKAQGLCDPHVRQMRRGEPIRKIRGSDMAGNVLSQEERFWEKVDRIGDCWIWTAGTIGDYGRFDGIYAHRFSWEIANGVPDEGWYLPELNPNGLVLDHDNPLYGCGNTLCVNPDHLEPVTFKVNTQRKRGLARNNTSGFRGVSWISDKGKYVAQAGHAGNTYHGGYFDDAEVAAAAAEQLRNEIAKESV